MLSYRCPRAAACNDLISLCDGTRYLMSDAARAFLCLKAKESVARARSDRIHIILAQAWHDKHHHQSISDVRSGVLPQTWGHWHASQRRGPQMEATVWSSMKSLIRMTRSVARRAAPREHEETAGVAPLFWHERRHHPHLECWLVQSLCTA